MRKYVFLLVLLVIAIGCGSDDLEDEYDTIGEGALELFPIDHTKTTQNVYSKQENVGIGMSISEVKKIMGELYTLFRWKEDAYHTYYWVDKVQKVVSDEIGAIMLLLRVTKKGVVIYKETFFGFPTQIEPSDVLRIK